MHTVSAQLANSLYGTYRQVYPQPLALACWHRTLPPHAGGKMRPSPVRQRCRTQVTHSANTQRGRQCQARLDGRDYPPPIPRLSTDLPTCTRGAIGARWHLSLLTPRLCSTYPQAYAHSYPQLAGKQGCAAAARHQSQGKGTTGAWQARQGTLHTAYAQACPHTYPLLADGLTHIVIHT